MAPALRSFPFVRFGFKESLQALVSIERFSDGIGFPLFVALTFLLNCCVLLCPLISFVMSSVAVVERHARFTLHLTLLQTTGTISHLAQSIADIALVPSLTVATKR